jgi:radical SAM protein with 4Fe4S-binding SPASM domain
MKVALPNIAFELTAGCNLDCVYCYNIWKTPETGIRPGQGSYKKSIKTLKEFFRQADVPNVTLTGGEPFLAERLTEVVLFCRMEGKGVAVITNGSQASAADYSDLVRVGVRLFELPIHSADSAVHDAMTGVAESWAKSIASIRHIRDLGADPVVVIVLTRFNIEGVADTLDFIAELGLRRVMINRYNIGGRHTVCLGEVSATHSELRAAFAEIDRKTAQLGLLVTSNVCTPQCLIDPRDYPHIGFGNCSPDPLRRPVTLDMDGNIRMCNHSPVVAGNIFETPLREILYSPYALSWGETMPAFCDGCGLWEKCLGGCRAASEQCGLGLSHPDPILTLMQ